LKYLYLFSIICFVSAFMMLKKSEKKQNFVEWLLIAYIIYACNNGITSVLLTACSLPINLFTLSIVDFTIAGLLAIPLIRSRKMQKYSVAISDIIVIVTILIVCIIVFFVDFSGFDFCIQYETSDPAVHYGIASQIFQNSQLTIREQSLTAYGLVGTAGPFLTSLNTAIIFMLFDGVISSLSFYKLYIIFDLFLLFLSGMVFYFSIKKFIYDKRFFAFSVFSVVLYMCGYPLNAVVFGIPELQFAIIVCGCIIIIGQKLYENVIYKYFVFYCIAVCITGVFYSYHLLVPALLVGIGISFLLYGFDFRHFKLKCPMKENIYIVLTLLVPIALGVLYLFVLPDKTGIINATSAITVPGYVYGNLYMDFVIPGIFSLFGLIVLIKRRNFSFALTMFFVFGAFSGALLYLAAKGKVSSYYFFKIHYILWFFVSYLAVVGCSYLYEKNKEIILAYVLCICLIFFIVFGQVDAKINKNYQLYDINVNSGAMLYVYNFNYTYMIDKNYIMNNAEIALLRYVEKNKAKIENENGEIPCIAGNMQKLWIYNTTGMWPTYNTEHNWATLWDTTFDFETWQNDSNSSYLVCFNGQLAAYMAATPVDFSQYHVIFQNAGGLVISK